MHMCVCLITLNLPLIICNLLIYSSIVIRETTLKNHISGSQREISISRIEFELPWSQLNLGSIKRLWCVHMPGIARDNCQEGRK